MKLSAAQRRRAVPHGKPVAPKVKLPRGMNRLEGTTVGRVRVLQSVGSLAKPVTLDIDDLRLVSELNVRCHWTVRDSRRKAQRWAVMAASLSFLRRIHTMPPPWVVTITRIGPRTLDDDNLRGSAKFVRDAVAHLLGVDDGDARVSWRYEQEKFKRYGVRIRIASIASGQGC